MKFIALASLAAVSQAVSITRKVPLEDINEDVTNEYESLSQAPGQNEFKVDMAQFGSPNQCKNGDIATVNYTGTLLDGRVFDSSEKGGYTNPIKFTVGASEVISCWDQALTQMHAGGEANLTCPPNMAYGQTSPGGIIPANATLKFNIKVVDCQSGF